MAKNDYIEIMEKNHMEIPWHDSYEQGINVPCQELFGRDCDYCNDDSRYYRWND